VSSSIFTREFWKDTAERVVSSAAQGALVGWAGVEVFASPEALLTAGEAALYGGAGMAVATFLKCLIASRGGDPGTASFVSLEPEPVGRHEGPVD
jgi:hypothetical protein